MPILPLDHPEPFTATLGVMPQYTFCQGERAAVGRSRMPIARIRPR